MRASPVMLAAAALLAGCTVGKNYAGPPVVAPVAAASPRFVRQGDDTIPAPPPARWWVALGDLQLDELEDRALALNDDVAAAAARLGQARAALAGQRANGAPKLGPTALYAHARLPGLDLENDSGNGNGGGGTTDTDIYNLGFNASWEIDLFGGQRRGVEAARATVGAAEAGAADAAVSVSAAVAQAYVSLRDRQARIALSARAIDRQERMVALGAQRYGRGAASKLDVARLRQALDDSRADAIPLGAERDAYLDALAALTGAEPGALDAMLAAPRPVPLPPASVAIGDPAALIARRPDIRAAERTLAADTARIGVAEAARFPRLTLLGIVGIGGTSPSDLTKLDDFTVLAAPQLNWNFLDFGRSRAKVLQAERVRDEALARYRGAVLVALRDAEDALSRFGHRRSAVATLARAKAAADEAVTLEGQRYRAGAGSLVELLDAERRQIAAEQSLSFAGAELTGDFVAIQKALGLGWSAPAR